ncbi:MAG: S24 family peptidase [Alphaproteobacteria bacterium]
MTFSERLSKLIEQLDGGKIRSFARRCDINHTSIQQYLNGSSPSVEKAIIIANACDVDVKWLITGDAQNVCDTSTVPVIEFASCGVATGWHNQKNLDYKIITHTKLKEDSFAVIAKGDSMEPEGIPDGTTCIISPSDKPVVGEPVYIKSKHREKSKDSCVAAIKLLQKIEKDKVYLKGWLPKENGKQEPFYDERALSYIEMLAPVVCIYNKKTPPQKVTNEIIEEKNKNDDIDDKKLAICIEAVRNANNLLDAAKLAKISTILYSKGIKDEKIDEKLLNDLLELIS